MTVYWEDLSEYERQAYRDHAKKQLWEIYTKQYPVAAWWGGGAVWERINVLGPCGRFPPYNQTADADSIEQAWQLLAEFVDRQPDERGKRTAIVLAHSVTDDPSQPYWLERLPPTKKGPFKRNPDDRRRKLEREAMSGDLDARSRLLQELLRAGEVTRDQLYLAGLLGDAAARNLLLARGSEGLPALMEPLPTMLPEMVNAYLHLWSHSEIQVRMFWRVMQLVARELEISLQQSASEIQGMLSYMMSIEVQAYAQTAQQLIDQAAALHYYAMDDTRFAIDGHLILNDPNSYHLVFADFAGLVRTTWPSITAGLPEFQKRLFLRIQQLVIDAVYNYTGSREI